MKIETEALPGALLVRAMEPRLDSAVAVQFKDAIRALAPNAPPRVILDMGRVQFLDSSGLGAVIAAMKALAPGAKLELATLQPAVEKVFVLTRMNQIFTIHRTVPAEDLAEVRHAG